MKTAPTHDLQQKLRHLKRLAWGCLLFGLAACAPQNATDPVQLSTGASQNATVVAVDVHRTTEKRHYAVAECSGTCKISYWAKQADSTVATVAVFTSASEISQIEIAALDNGGAALVWVQRSSGGAPVFRFATVSAAGVADTPADLTGSDATITGFTPIRRYIGLSAGGGKAYAAWVVGSADQAQLRYRQIWPSLSSPGTVMDTTPLGSPAYIDGLNLGVDAGGAAHLAWRHVRIGGPGVGFGVVGYARHTGAGSPNLTHVEVARGGGGARSYYQPSLYLNESIAGQAWLGYKGAEPGSDDAVYATRIDSSALVLTRTLIIDGAAGWQVAGGVEAPEITWHISNPMLAFVAKSPATAGVFEVFAWNTGTADVFRVSSTGNIRSVRAAAVTSSRGAVLAYSSLNSTTGASALMAYDVTHERTVTLDTRPACQGSACVKYGIDIAGRLNTVAGVWIVRPPDASRPYAFEARNDSTPTSNLIVDSLNDTNTDDAVITLREAMAVANGTLATGFSATERAKLETAGCIFDVGGSIVAGCGRGVTDTIQFTDTLGGQITLGGALPVINDSRPTRIVGRDSFATLAPARTVASAESAASPAPLVINGSGVPGLTAIFVVTSSNNTIEGLSLYSAQRGVLVQGNTNRIEGLTVLSHTVAGIQVDGGDDNRLVRLNTFDPAADNAGCVRGVNRVGVLITNGALNNLLGFVLTGCSDDYGVVVEGSGSTGNRLLLFGSLGASFDDAFSPTVSATHRNRLANAIIRNGANDTLVSNAQLGGSQDGLVIQNAANTTIVSTRFGNQSGASIVLRGAGTVGTVISETTMSASPIGIFETGAASGNTWELTAYFAVPRPVDKDPIGTANPPPGTIVSINPLMRSIAGSGVPPGATVEVFVDVTGGPLPITATLLNARTTADASGAWSASLDSIRLPGAGGCYRFIVTTPTGSSEMSAAVCRYQLGMPLITR
jgi:hypothetical protein